MPKKTTDVAVMFTLDSSVPSPPYYMSDCSGKITYDDGTHDPIEGWGRQRIGSPQGNGASFSVTIVDSSHQANRTEVQNWAVIFIPRGTTTAASPFGNNVHTITGSGPVTQTGTTELDLNGVRIKKDGSWNWAVMVQVKFEDGSIHCFDCDPEMDVDA